MKEALKYFKDRQDYLNAGSTKQHEFKAIRALEMQMRTDKKFYCNLMENGRMANECELDTIEEVCEFSKKLAGYELMAKDFDQLIKAGEIDIQSKNGELLDGKWQLRVMVVID